MPVAFSSTLSSRCNYWICQGHLGQSGHLVSQDSRVPDPILNIIVEKCRNVKKNFTDETMDKILISFGLYLLGLNTKYINHLVDTLNRIIYKCIRLMLRYIYSSSLYIMCLDNSKVYI